MWEAIHTRLQDACIELWPKEVDCRRLVMDAEIDSRHISFGDPVALRWQFTIDECRKQRSLPRLVPVLLRDYPDNEILQLAISPWRNGVGTKGKTGMEQTPGSTTVTSEEGVVKLTAPATIVVSTPDAAGSTDSPIAAVTAPSEPELVPVLVPKEMVEKAQLALVATIDSLRRDIAQHEKDLQELKAWREQLSKLSRAEVAVLTGGNESQGGKQ